MSNSRGLKIFGRTLLFFAGAAAGMFLSRLCPFMRLQAEVITRTDTLTLRDTIRETRPVYVTNREIDTMLVVVTDTVTISDTVYLVLGREQRHYRGDDYEAWVSGYRPQLDSVWVYPETRYITKEVTVQEKGKRWGIGVQVGYGMSVPGGKPVFSPYVGIGISWNFIRF